MRHDRRRQPRARRAYGGANAAAPSYLLELLEQRRLMTITIDAGGVVHVVGTAQADYLVFTTEGNRLTVEHYQESFGYQFGERIDFAVFNGGVTGISVDLGAGNDGVYYPLGYGRTNVPMTLSGGAGDDYLLGGNADDVLIGGTGDDTLLGAAGNDTFFDESRSGTESAGEDDALMPFVDEQGVLVFRGTQYDDDISLGYDPDYRIWLVEMYGDCVGTFFVGVTGIRMEGLGGDDHLGVYEGANDCPVPVTILGGEGNDTLHGTRDADTLFGGDGIDFIVGEGGMDTMDSDPPPAPPTPLVIPDEPDPDPISAVDPATNDNAGPAGEDDPQGIISVAPVTFAPTAQPFHTGASLLKDEHALWDAAA